MLNHLYLSIDRKTSVYVRRIEREYMDVVSRQINNNIVYV